MKHLVLAVFITTTSAAMAQNEVFPIEKWKVQSGDNPAWASPGFDDSAWPAGTLPGLRSTGFRWYRATVTLTEKWRNQPLALGFGPMGEAFEVFVDGAHAGGLGVMDPAPVSTFVRHLSIDVPLAAGTSGTLHIAVRRWMGLSSPYLGGLLVTGIGFHEHLPQIGPASLLQTREQLHSLEAEKSAALTQALVLFSGLVGLLSLMLFAQHRERREYLWLGLMFATSALSVLFALYAVKLDLPVRSTIPAIRSLLYWSAPACAAMLMGQLCPRLRWPIWITAALHFALTFYFAIAMIANLVIYNPMNYFNPIGGVLQIATAILIFRDNRHGFYLSISLLLVPIVLVLAQFGIIGGHYLWNGYDVDLLQMSLAIFAVVTLTIIWLRSRREQSEQQAREQDLAAGQKVQQLLLGSVGGTPGFQVQKAYLPAREVGGDLYKLIARADGSLLAVVGDVSGKGLEAAMMGARLLGALGLVKHLMPGEVLAQLNDATRGPSHVGFITCCCALFAADGTVTLANAGHLAPYLNGAEVPTEAGLPLGLAPGAEYAETQVSLGSGAITFVTDGVVEAENAQRELFGFDRTRAISTQPAQSIADAAKSWGQNDDITVVTVRRNA